MTVVATRDAAAGGDGGEVRFEAIARLDGPIEVDYYRGGGILPAVLRRLATEAVTRAPTAGAAGTKKPPGEDRGLHRGGGCSSFCPLDAATSIVVTPPMTAAPATMPPTVQSRTVTDAARTVQRTYLRPDPAHDARRVVHLGHQHALPARRRPDQHRGLRGQRVLRGRPGHLRGPDRRRRRHARPALLVPARRGDPARLDAALPRHVADPRAASSAGPSPRSCSASASRSSRERPRPGSSTRSTRPASPATSSRSSGGPRRSAAAAMLVGSVLGGVVAQATDLGVPYLLRAAMLGVTLVVAFRFMHDLGLQAATRAPARSPRSGTSSAARSTAGWRNPPVRWLMLAGAVHGRRRLLRVLRAAAVPARAVRRPRARTASPGWRRPSSPAPRSSAACWSRGSAGCSAADGRAAHRRRPSTSVLLVLIGLTDELRHRARAADGMGAGLRHRGAAAPGVHQRRDPIRATRHGPLVRLADGLDRRRRRSSRRSGGSRTSTATPPRTSSRPASRPCRCRSSASPAASARRRTRSPTTPSRRPVEPAPPEALRAATRSRRR